MSQNLYDCISKIRAGVGEKGGGWGWALWVAGWSINTIQNEIIKEVKKKGSLTFTELFKIFKDVLLDKVINMIDEHFKEENPNFDINTVGQRQLLVSFLSTARKEGEYFIKDYNVVKENQPIIELSADGLPNESPNNKTPIYVMEFRNCIQAALEEEISKSGPQLPHAPPPPPRQVHPDRRSSRNLSRSRSRSRNLSRSRSRNLSRSRSRAQRSSSRSRAQRGRKGSRSRTPINLRRGKKWKDKWRGTLLKRREDEHEKEQKIKHENEQKIKHEKEQKEQKIKHEKEQKEKKIEGDAMDKLERQMGSIAYGGKERSKRSKKKPKKRTNKKSRKKTHNRVTSPKKRIKYK